MSKESDKYYAMAAEIINLQSQAHKLLARIAELEQPAGDESEVVFALKELLAQVETFCAEHGEADFETKRANDALANWQASSQQPAVPDTHQIVPKIADLVIAQAMVDSDVTAEGPLVSIKQAANLYNAAMLAAAQGRG